MLHAYLKKIIISILLTIFSLAGLAQESPTTPLPQTTAAQTPQPLITPAPPDLNVKAYVLMDANSGKILAQKNMDQSHPPASLTKLMTMYLASRALNMGSIHLDDQVKISEKAWKMGGSKMFIRVGNDVSVKDLIQGIIVDSGNDACVAMAEYIAGDENSFVSMMNAQAQAVGMTNTHYMDCTGLPNTQHYSTAHDLAMLTRAIIQDYPEDYKWYKQKWFTYNKIRQPNRNRLLWRYPYADGLKTGHTNAAGYCLVASAVRDNLRLIAVVLGAPSDAARADDSIRLLNYGFRFFESHLLYQAGSIISKVRVWYGENRMLNAGVQHDVYVTIPKGQYQHIKVNVIAANHLKAPIKKGQPVGQIVVSLNGDTVETQPLIALDDNAKGGIWRHLYDWVARLI